MCHLKFGIYHTCIIFRTYEYGEFYDNDRKTSAVVLGGGAIQQTRRMTLQCSICHFIQPDSQLVCSTC